MAGGLVRQSQCLAAAGKSQDSAGSVVQGLVPPGQIEQPARDRLVALLVAEEAGHAEAGGGRGFQPQAEGGEDLDP